VPPSKSLAWLASLMSDRGDDACTYARGGKGMGGHYAEGKQLREGCKKQDLEGYTTRSKKCKIDVILLTIA